jgi:hypothetical protein
MSASQQTPGRPARGGRRPRQPPCPACGEPLFGWIDERPGLAGPVRRCESCGLGVVGEPGGAEEALRELDLRASRGRARDDRQPGGFSAWMGGAGWAGLEGGAHYLFTVEAVRRSSPARPGRQAARWAPGRAIRTMWQTILNGFTFGRNIALARAGTQRRVAGRATWQRRLDALSASS